MIRATVAIFAGGAAEFRHRHYNRVLAEIAEIGPEGGNGLRKVAEHVGDLAFGRAFVDVMVPSTDIGECYLHAEIRFDELSELAQAVAKPSPGIIGAGRGFVLRWIRRPEHVHGVKSLRPGAVKYRIERVIVHRLERVRDRRSLRIQSSDREVVDVIHCDSRFKSTQDAGDGGTHRDGLEGRFLRRMRKVAQRAVEPSIFCGFYSRSAGLHKILRIEVRTAGVGRSGSVHNCKLTLIPKWLERRQGRMQPEESVEIENGTARNVDAGPQRVILRFTVRHYDVETVSRTPLKNHYQALVACARVRGSPCGASKEAGHSGRADDRERAITKKDSTCDGHKNSS